MSTMSEGGDTTPVTGYDVVSMAEVLEGRHGEHAAGVADFLSSFHQVQGDAGRSWAWAGVAVMVRRREQQRLMRR